MSPEIADRFYWILFPGNAMTRDMLIVGRSNGYILLRLICLEKQLSLCPKNPFTFSHFELKIAS